MLWGAHFDMKREFTKLLLFGHAGKYLPVNRSRSGGGIPTENRDLQSLTIKSAIADDMLFPRGTMEHEFRGCHNEVHLISIKLTNHP